MPVMGGVESGPLPLTRGLGEADAGGMGVAGVLLDQAITMLIPCAKARRTRGPVSIRGFKPDVIEARINTHCSRCVIKHKYSLNSVGRVETHKHPPVTWGLNADLQTEAPEVDTNNPDSIPRSSFSPSPPAFNDGASST